MSSPRHGRAINVNLTPPARDGWDRLAEQQGADVTALLEVMGLALLESPRTLRLGEVGRQARVLSQERRRRRT
jgi:hypothetical protein